MAQTTERKQELIDQFQQDESDTGSAPVQIALLTDRINDLTEHLEKYPNDHDSRRGLLTLVGKRQSLLDYLRDNEPQTYDEVVSELGI